MKKKLFPCAFARKKASVAFSLSVFVLFSCIAVSANSGSKNAPRPVARLVATSRQDVPARPRARLITSGKAAPSFAAMPSARAAAPAAVAALATSDEQRAFELINSKRRARGLEPLVWDGELCRLARYHSENMARQNFFSHTGKDGLDTAERARSLGVRGWRALGENIAYNQGFDDPVAFAVERWMHSEKHRDNALSEAFTHSGLGVAKSADGRIFFTQVFVTR